MSVPGDEQKREPPSIGARAVSDATTNSICFEMQIWLYVPAMARSGRALARTAIVDIDGFTKARANTGDGQSSGNGEMDSSMSVSSVKLTSKLSIWHR